VLKPGGTIKINLYGTAESPFVKEALRSFRDAGFAADLAPGPRPGEVGPGTIAGRKP
jgi:hypothetical protein